MSFSPKWMWWIWSQKQWRCRVASAESFVFPSTPTADLLYRIDCYRKESIDELISVVPILEKTCMSSTCNFNSFFMFFSFNLATALSLENDVLDTMGYGTWFTVKKSLLESCTCHKSPDTTTNFQEKFHYSCNMWKDLK